MISPGSLISGSSCRPKWERRHLSSHFIGLTATAHLFRRVSVAGSPIRDRPGKQFGLNSSPFRFCRFSFSDHNYFPVLRPQASSLDQRPVAIRHCFEGESNGGSSGSVEDVAADESAPAPRSFQDSAASLRSIMVMPFPGAQLLSLGRRYVSSHTGTHKLQARNPSAGITQILRLQMYAGQSFALA